MRFEHDDTMIDDDDALDSPDALDASSLAGISEYSATGGGSWPAHIPQLSRDVEERGHVPDTTSIEDLYRYSLARATEDDHSSVDTRERADDGPLRVDRHRS